MLNNPFCYTPSPRIVEAARALIARIDADPSLRALFAEGKMLGVLEVTGVMPGCDRASHFLYAFSGLAGGSAFVDGFVPPIFAWKPEDIQSSSPEESQRLQEWLFEQYVVVNGRGEHRSIRQIFADRGLVPPGGTGDCAAPKLLQYALTHGLTPLAIGEFWYGASPSREVRRSGAFYPACTGKCGPLLGYMMQGLDVEPNPLESDAHWHLAEPVVRYEDNVLIVAEKPAGMLAVPGRPIPGVPPRRSLQDWLRDHCGGLTGDGPSADGPSADGPSADGPSADGPSVAESTVAEPVLACHRLDMDTSGLMIFAKTPEAQASLQQQFEHREVTKAYLARLSADGEKPLRPGDTGKIVLPLVPDWYDRPRQCVDPEHGKPAVTGYEVLSVNDAGEPFVRLLPYTGRTHQLRVHCAHAAGLGRPIVGDRLYGGPQADRLMLHASYLSFRHPTDGRRLTFESDFSPILI